ncbi:MAG: DNA gyrase subunit A [Oscillospiraceae bacterium]|nr:DNA gyrase subunit A [Oscillospiraceae bacterium]MDE7172441.1 DNA gyrase subunit A [Oscillospiraceae bacterium]
MGHNRNYKPEDIAFPNQVITESELVGEMAESYKQYAMSVIVGRALPDVRDGLKPVHRRILYSMYDTGLTSDKPFKKSATCVGEVLGHYHPHGDASVYDAMVRLVQKFSMRYPLVEGHGNFGNVDGDPPAANRYTEARMAKVANEMLRDIDKDTVDWDPNFDESLKEPRVLPSRFPNLLVNGSSGIAVGMATNIPPHNLREAIDAAICVLDDPNAGLNDLMEHIKGPDFPTKGIIMGRAGIRAAYATGRGKIVLRARTEFEEFGKDRTRIIVTELPYQVNKRQLIRTIADQVKDKRLEGISDLRDETDRNGMRIVIELKQNANPQVVLNKLFKQTALQSNFSIIMLALVDDQKQPRILSLRGILDEYIAFQEQVIRRRTEYDLKKAQERAHLLEGLLIAQDNIDEVIHIIRSSYDNAKQNLMDRFGLDDVQAQAICDMRLISLQGLNREKLEAEYKELEEKIAYYNELLADEEKLKGVLRDELIQIRDKYGDGRITEIQDVADEIDIEDLIEEEQSVFTMTANGYIKRTAASEYAAQGKGGMGRKGMATREEDYVNTVFTSSTHDYILFFTDKGRVFRKKGYEIPEAGRTARGTNIVNVLQVEQDEKVAVMIHTRDISEGDEPRYLTMFTRNGTVKRLDASALRNLRNNGLRVILLDEGDELIEVRETDGHQNLLIATHDGMAVCFDENQIRPTGRNSMGVRGIRLRAGDYVVGAARAKPDRAVLTITENGFGKRTPVEEYTIHNRGGLGMKNYLVTEKTGPVVGVKVVDGSEDLLLVTQSGTLIRTDVDGIRMVGRASQGVIVMRFKEEGDKVVAMSLAEKEEASEEPEVPSEESETPVENTEIEAPAEE